MRRAAGKLFCTLVALGAFAACLEIASVDEPSPSTGGAAGTGGDAAQEALLWPDGAAGESSTTDALADSEPPDVSDSSDPTDSSDAAPDVPEAGTTYAAEVLKDGPELYWRLDELTGPIATDSSGKNNHGKYLGTTFSYAVTGALKTDGNKAVELGGGYLEAADLFDFPAKAPFTFELWVRPKGIQTDYARLASKETIGSNRTGWTVFLDDANSKPVLKAERWSEGSVNVVGYSSSLVSTSFRHVVATYNGVQLHLYVDGVEVAAATSSLDLLDTSSPLRIGAVTANGNNYFGAMDEIAIYAHALSAVRISAHFAAAGY